MNVKAKRTYRIAVPAVLASVLVPMLFAPGFVPAAPTSLAFYAVLAAYGVLLMYGVAWARQLMPQVWTVPYFIVQIGLFAAANVLPVPRDSVWILAMPIVSLATATLRPWWATSVAAIYLAVFGWYLRGLGVPWRGVFTAITSISVAMVFTAGCTLLAMWADRSRERAELLAKKLETANAELRAAAERTAALATAQERNRIARDIHDGLGHYLTVVAVQLQAARALLAAQPDRAVEAIDKAELAARTALDDVRRSVGALRESGPRPVLAEALAGLARESGLAVAFECAGSPRPLAEAAEQALFRTVQEALTNVRKHAATAQAQVSLNFSDTARVVVEVADAGRGRSSVSPASGFGLPGLRERLATVGGTLVADNRPGGGFLVRAEVPA